jgi:energy-coupling factor transporter ATP-binding protein EcfA2
MRRLIATVAILGVGIPLMLWAFDNALTTLSKYGIVKVKPLAIQINPEIITGAVSLMLLATTTTIIIVAVIRSRRLLGVIPLKELQRHVLIVGPTGSGKTTIAKRILEMVTKRNVRVTIIDWKGEYKEFIPGATIVRKIDNIWDVPGESAKEKALLAVELVREMSKDVIEITPASSLLLLKVLEEEYRRGVPTTEKIIDILEKSAMIAQREGRHAESNMYLALIRRLYVLLVDEERKVENVRGSPELVVYDLGQLPSVYLKTLYCNYILASLYRQAIKAIKARLSDGLKTLVVAEEAQNYVIMRRSNEVPSLVERIVYELRSFGVGVVLVCPDSELLPSPILKDVGTIIATSPDSLPRFALERYLFRASLEEAEKTLKALKRAKAIIYFRGKLYFLHKLPKPNLKPKLKARPKGDRMGVTDQGAGSLRAWPILPHRSPGRPAPKVVEVEERTEVEPKAVEAEKPKIVEVPETIEAVSEPIEEKKVEEPTVEVKKEIEEEKEEMVEEVPIEEPEPVPKGPPIPSLLPL